MILVAASSILSLINLHSFFFLRGAHSFRRAVVVTVAAVVIQFDIVLEVDAVRERMKSTTRTNHRNETANE